MRHNTGLVDEIGDIVIENNRFRFMTVDSPDGAETILDIKAGQIEPID